ncbi:hypothetical protein ACQ4PT_040095 [Festuca glaucescens]
MVNQRTHQVQYGVVIFSAPCAAISLHRSRVQTVHTRHDGGGGGSRVRNRGAASTAPSPSRAATRNQSSAKGDRVLLVLSSRVAIKGPAEAISAAVSDFGGEQQPTSYQVRRLQVLLGPWQIYVGSMEKGNADDRLSNLPNDILVNILDRLNVRDAARTSVLSRRWIQLPAMLSRLTITAQNFRRPRTSMSDDELLRINAAVAEATKSILARRDPGGCTIRFLSTTFYLRDDTPISVGRTVGNAMATHEIEKAEFTVLTEKESLEFTIDDMLNYVRQFVSFFNE